MEHDAGMRRAFEQLAGMVEESIYKLDICIDKQTVCFFAYKLYIYIYVQTVYLQIRNASYIYIHMNVYSYIYNEWQWSTMRGCGGRSSSWKIWQRSLSDTRPVSTGLP